MVNYEFLDDEDGDGRVKCCGSLMVREHSSRKALNISVVGRIGLPLNLYCLSFEYQ